MVIFKSYNQCPRLKFIKFPRLNLFNDSLFKHFIFFVLNAKFDLILKLIEINFLNFFSWNKNQRKYEGVLKATRLITQNLNAIRDQINTVIIWFIF